MNECGASGPATGDRPNGDQPRSVASWLVGLHWPACAAGRHVHACRAPRGDVSLPHVPPPTRFVFVGCAENSFLGWLLGSVATGEERPAANHVVAQDVHRTRAVAAGAARRAEAWTAPRGCAARAWHGGGSAIAQLAHGHPECVAAAAAARPAVEAAAVFVVVVATAAPAIKAAAAWAGAAVTHRQRRSRRHELAAGLARDESRANTGRHARLAAS